MAKKKKLKVKAVRILKVHSIAPEEHVITSEVHVEAPLAELPDVVPTTIADAPVEFDPPVEFHPKQKKHGWATWWKSLWD
jgi:hypothetical protein